MARGDPSPSPCSQPCSAQQPVSHCHAPRVTEARCSDITSHISRVLPGRWTLQHRGPRLSHTQAWMRGCDVFLGKHGCGFLTPIIQEENWAKVKLVTRQCPHRLFQTHCGPLSPSLTQLQIPQASCPFFKCAQLLLTFAYAVPSAHNALPASHA